MPEQRLHNAVVAVTRSRVAERPLLAGLLVAFICLGWGGSWDAHWHLWIGRHSVWIPPHIFLYAGIGLSVVLAVVMALRRTPSPRAGPNATATGWRLPRTHHVFGVGAATMMAAAVIDILWHRTIGDLTIWSPPHVLFVLGGLTVALGTAMAFVRAGRDGVIPDALARTATGALVGVLLNAGYFGLLPGAVLILYPESAAGSMLRVLPSPYALAVIASLVMPAILLVSRGVLGRWRSGLGAVALTGFVFWTAQVLLHLALTLPVAAAFGYAIRPSRFPHWPFELAIFGAAVAPVVATSSLIRRWPSVGGAFSGVLFASEVQIGLHVLGVPAGINAWGFAACALFGSASGVAGTACGRWIGNVIYSEPRDARVVTLPENRGVLSPMQRHSPYALSAGGVVVDFLGFLCRVSPNLRRRLSKLLYDILAARDDDADWAFMNYGFVDLDAHAARLQLAPSDEKDRCAVQLYHHVAESVDLRGRDVIEVGCGRGGGASYIARYLRPRSMVGVDFSREAIAHCRRHRIVAGLSFADGDAEALPFDDGQFDVVINIESSHCYGSMDRFLAEAYRVLRPDGVLLFADLRFNDGIVRLRDQLRSSRFQLLEQHTITRNVVRALEWDHERRLALIRQKVPPLFHGPILRFAGAKGTRTYEMLRDGQGEYLCCMLSKAAT